MYITTTVFVCINSLKLVFEFKLGNKVGFIMSLENWLEISTYVCTILAINLGHDQYLQKTNYGSWAVLSAFVVYPMYLQKMRVLGVYVVAVVKTLKNTLKFFPVFLIVLMGFILVFFMRFHNGIKLGKINKLFFGDSQILNNRKKYNITL